jgi:hypothetical protein
VTPSIPDPGFADDVGDPDPTLLAALAAYSAASAPTQVHGHAVLEALSRARLLVPIVAVLESLDDQAVGVEKESAMATVVVDGGDGRRALLAFTGVASLAAWRADARPAPVPAPAAARSALAESADTLLIDAAGPAPFAVADAELRALAASSVEGAPATAADVTAVLRSCLRAIPEITSVRLVRAEGVGPTVVLGAVPGLSEAELAAVLERVTGTLRDDVAVRTLLPGGAHLFVTPQDGPDGADTSQA